MRSLVCCLVAIFTISGVTTSEKMSLNERLEKRILLNKQYKKDNVGSITDEKHSELLRKCEAGVADAWMELLIFAKNSKDEELKRVVLRLEYCEELRTFAYQKEYAESEEDMTKANKGLKQYEDYISEISSKKEK